MVLNIILVVVFLICVAMLWNEGMWSNAVSLLNTILAGLVATNAWEIVANYMEEQMPSYSYLCDFIGLWATFCLTYAVLRATTDQISKHRIKFKKPIEEAGRIVFSVWTAWVLVCFTTFSLHMAPLAKDSFRGSFHYTQDQKNFFDTAPDWLWLGFAQSRSIGPLSRADAERPDGVRMFDPNSDFMARYANRRAELEKEEGLRVKR